MNRLERKQILVTQTPCQPFVESLKSGLTGAGFWAFQSFDLQSTRAMHEGCTCPHHGTEHCTCEMVVLLVYHAAGDPATLIVDGRDNQAFVYLAEEAGKSLPRQVEEGIRLVVEQTAAKVQLSIKPDAPV